MDHAAHNKIVSFIWSIADDCLRDVFVRGKYRDVILPMFVLRRIDCLLEDTKAAVLEEVRFQKKEAKMAVLDPEGLRDAAGQVFYNTSQFTLKTLLGNPSQLVANLHHYLDGFSDNVREIITKFGLSTQIAKLHEANALFGVIEKFVSPEINLSPHDVLAPDGKKLVGLSNLGMGYVFEELIRKFNEENNEEAGEHFTPREVIQLMVHLIFEPIKKKLPPVITIYDPACGSGGMLTEAQDFIIDPEGVIKSDSPVHLYGREINPETYAICKSDMMIKGNNPENIRFGSTLATDEFSTLRFDFMLSNPPYGKSWKTDQGQILEKKGSETVIIDGRFEVVLPDANGEKKTVPAAPAVDDGQLLFLMEMVSKMKRLKDSPLGSRIATVHNGSALFTGNAGGGASNIRRYLIENDMLEAIIQLPNNIFYNTGITTYIWVLSNHKAKERKGKVQLIDASQLYEKLRKNLGEKNCAFTQAHIDQITQAYLNMDERSADTGAQNGSADTPVRCLNTPERAGVPALPSPPLKSKIFPNNEFGYWKITVERPLRKSAQYSSDRIATLRFIPALATEMEGIWQQWGKKVYDQGFLTSKKETIEQWLEKEQIETSPANKKKLLETATWTGRRDLMQTAEKLHEHLGEAVSHDFNVFAEDTRKAVKKLKLDLKLADVKAILDAVSWRDPEAEPICNSQSILELSPDCDWDELRCYSSHIEGAGFPEKEIRDKLKEPGYRLLVVANKFLTGFNEPLLHTMYVDKKLQGVLAVQTLSRLNRCNVKMAKQNTFILDFYNTAQEIKDAFDPFYTATSLSEPTDINVLHDLKDELDDAEVYNQEDVDRFNEAFFKKAPPELLHPIIDHCVARFDLIEDEDDKIDFKIKAKQFVKIYGQLACIIPFENLNWENLHWFLKFLVPKLKVKDKDKEELDALLESVDLSTYALERVRLNEHIGLDASASTLEPQNPNVRGHHGGEEEREPLDDIITAFNERWFSAWSATPEEQRVKLVNIVERVKKSPDYQKQVVDNPDEQNRRLALEALINQAVLAQRKTDMELYMLRQDEAFKQAFNETVMRILSMQEKTKAA